MNGLKIIVLAKQVPDTRNVGKDAMTEEGTVNRGALPAIFNPEDLNALELALRIKDRHPEGTAIMLLTMGPPRAADIIREGLYRGADGGYLLTDRAFAGSDTLATSYALSCAIRAIGAFDLIICGRQAIDGDTAQVGPQVAEKLGITQITYAEEVKKIENNKIRIKRRLDRGVEIVESAMPLLITVNGSAPECRPRNVKLVMKYKHAKTSSELPEKPALYLERSYLNIAEIAAKDINANANDLGLSGSPTKVKKIENIVFQAKDTKQLTNADADIEGLMVELIANHTLG
jgi:electron transfer flavoprotein beta subunit